MHVYEKYCRLLLWVDTTKERVGNKNCTSVPTLLALQRDTLGLLTWRYRALLASIAFGARTDHWAATSFSLEESRRVVLSSCSSPGPPCLSDSCCWSAARCFTDDTRGSDVFSSSITYIKLPSLLAQPVQWLRGLTQGWRLSGWRTAQVRQIILTGRRKCLVNWKQRAARGVESFLPICCFHDIKSGDMKYPNFLS